MATQEKLRQRIAQLIERPANVEFEEIAWVLNQLGCKSPRATRHGFLFLIPNSDLTLQLNKHNNGKAKLPPYCVKDFRDCMTELGLYGSDDEL